VLRIINEPTAAAIAYGLDKRSKGKEQPGVGSPGAFGEGCTGFNSLSDNLPAFM
jgi:hypothetical protein